MHKTSRLLESLNLTRNHAVYCQEGNRLLAGVAVLRHLLIQLQSTGGSPGPAKHLRASQCGGRGGLCREHPAFRLLCPCQGTGVSQGARERTDLLAIAIPLAASAGERFPCSFCFVLTYLPCHFHKAYVEGGLLARAIYQRPRVILRTAGTLQ